MAKINLFGFNIPYEVILGSLGIILLLEATRRAIGIPLVIIALIFLLFSIFGQSMPDLISHQGLSDYKISGISLVWRRSHIWNTYKCFSKFHFFICIIWCNFRCSWRRKIFLEFSIFSCRKNERWTCESCNFASGLTGLISGSSVANTVTTGTFTIPIMKKTGLPPVKAGAVEGSCIG